VFTNSIRANSAQISYCNYAGTEDKKGLPVSEERAGSLQANSEGKISSRRCRLFINPLEAYDERGIKAGSQAFIHNEDILSEDAAVPDKRTEIIEDMQKRIMGICVQVTGEIRVAIPRSTNNHLLVGLPYYKYEHADGTVEKRYVHDGGSEDVDKLRGIRRYADTVGRNNLSAVFLILSELSPIAGVGNCGDLTIALSRELKKQGLERVEIVEISEDTEESEDTERVICHHVVVVNRTKNNWTSLKVDGNCVASNYCNNTYTYRQNIGLPSSSDWSDDAIFCDPWARVVYPARDYKMFWGETIFPANPRNVTCRLIYVQPSLSE